MKKKKQKLNKVFIFFDFQCTYCFDYIKEIQNINQNLNVEIVYYPFLKKEDEITNIQKANFCAYKQNRFWEMYRSLYRVDNISDEDLIVKAESINLDLDLFKVCLEGDDINSEIQRGIDLLKNLDIKVVPTTVLDNHKYKGYMPIENLEREIRTVF